MLTCLSVASKATESALALWKCLKVHPTPNDLIGLYDSVIPRVRTVPASKAIIMLTLVPLSLCWTLSPR